MRRVGSETIWEGPISTVRIDRVEHDDGEVVEREVHAHPGAVAVIAHDDEHVWLVRQPREAPDEAGLLEIPAGKLDADDEHHLETAKRELAEEIGKGAREWRYLTWFYTSPGFTDELCHLYLATDLHDSSAEAEENERIEVVRWPLADLDALIDELHDAKSVIGALWLRALRRA